MLIKSEKIEEILKFERDAMEFATRPRTKEADDFWMYEWFKKCSKIQKYIDKEKNNG